MSETVRWKEVVTTAHFHNCEDCPKYFYDMEDGDLCILVSPSKQVNKYGKEIPEWCPLTDVPDPNKRRGEPNGN